MIASLAFCEKVSFLWLVSYGIFVFAEMGVFSVIFHHGGNFVQDNHTFYRGGSETIVQGQNSDKWSFFEPVSLVKDWGYDGFRLWRKIPNVDDIFTHFVDDAQA